MANQSLGIILRHIRQLMGTAGAQEESDGQLSLERFAVERDEPAFEALLRRHGPMVLGVCRRVLNDADDAADAFQATFLVLARKAGTIHNREAVGSWLHGAAHRIALKARTQLARRRAREREAAIMSIPPTIAEPAWQKLRPVLDEELRGLPRKYRAPLVLCYLEGKTNEQAARQLGWPIGSMSRRLARGRELLRQRLTGRGVSLAGTAITAISLQGVATAAVPEALVGATLTGALQVGAASAAVEALAAAALAESTLRPLALARWQVAAVVLLAVGAAGTGAALFAHRTLNPEPPAADMFLELLADGGLAAAIDRRVQQLQPTPEERRIDRIGWARNIRDALRLAREHRRPVFLFAHEGRIATGRCGGSAFNLRAHSLADERIIALLNRHFVPVYASSDDYGASGPFAPEERAERTRISHTSIAAKMYAGEDCIYLLTPEGQPFDTLDIPTARKPDQLLERLQLAVRKLDAPAGDPVCRPMPQSVPPSAGPGELALHLSARVGHRRSWSEFPAENWLVLSPAEVERLLPPAAESASESWDLDRAVATRLLTWFYPQTENNDVSRNRIDRLELRATVVTREEGSVRARLDGRLTMKHAFYPTREDDLVVEATLTGYLDFDPRSGRLLTLRLLTDRATYGRHTFAVALRSLP